ncbi:C6 finger domain-containing protein [Colletotrichum asianum]
MYDTIVDPAAASSTSGPQTSVSRRGPNPSSLPAGLLWTASRAITVNSNSDSNSPSESAKDHGPRNRSAESLRPRAEHLRMAPKISHVPLIVPPDLDCDEGSFQMLFQHFLSRSMPSMSVDNVGTELYVSTLLPVIVSDNLVLRSVLALSSLQYMLSHPENDKALKLASTCYSKALSAMRARVALSDTGAQDDRPDCLCAASLMLALTESARGDSTRNHVDFASHVLQTMSNSVRLGINQKLYRNMLRVCMFLRVDEAVETIPSPFTSAQLVNQMDMSILAGHLWDAEHRASATELSEECGLFQTPFIAGLLTIHHLARLRAADGVANIDKDERVTQLLAIEMQIMSTTTHKPAGPASLDAVAIGYAHTLYESPVDGKFWQASRRNDCYESFMKELKLVPKGHESIGVMLWPISMAGSCARSSAHRELIQQQLTESCDTLSARMLAVVANMLQQMWDGTAANPAGDKREEELVIDPSLISPESLQEK